MWTLENAIVIGLTFFVAGAVKGVIGLGLPTVALALLTTALGLKEAMALLLFPSFVTNVWQGLAGGALAAILARTWTLLAAVCAATWIGVAILAATDARVMSALLGGLLCVYAALSLSKLRMPGPDRRLEPWLSPLVGAVNGVLTGMTGSFVVPGVLYLQALGLPREVLIQAMGVLFTVSTLALAVSLNDQRLLSPELAILSGAAIPPALIGMAVGQKVRRRLSEATFRKLLFGSLAALGAYIAVRSLS
ncbi:MAG TPA: sulfite exporter TauE/SafE family protein [Alphaproteobacteria bacterium]|nr:sulfite exporter TauE/SafE family protein [Alphaproteobacteria bacterium]